MVKNYPYKGKDGRWYKPCSKCGKICDYLRYQYALQSYKLDKKCKSCSNKETDNCHRGWYKGIRISWFNKFKISAEYRAIEFNITIDDVAELIQKQNFKCALSGWDISFPETGIPQKCDASIDRIDSKKGYSVENIQITHKTINMIKNKYDNDFFIYVCKSISENANR
jgi:hypothetical protein